jgi:hypothetical protein
MTTIFSYDQTKTHSSEHRDSKGTLPAFFILAILAGRWLRPRTAPLTVWCAAALVAVACGPEPSGLMRVSSMRARMHARAGIRAWEPFKEGFLAG